MFPRPRLLAVIAILTLFGFPALALAEGGFVWKRGGGLFEPSQKALIVHDHGIEDLVLQVSCEGPAEELAWLVPLPSQPTVRAIDGDLFEELSRYTQDRDHWAAFQRIRGLREANDVVRIERRKVGVFDVAVVHATDAGELSAWLNRNGFTVSPKALSVFARYLEQGWVFTAIRIDPDERRLWGEKGLRRGALVPIQFTFKTKQAIYPLSISRLNRGEIEVLLYVLARDVLVHADFTVPAPSVDEFYLNSLFASTRGGRDVAARREFTARFDVGRSFFRSLRSGELPRCESLFPRIGVRPYFLTKLCGAFRPDTIRGDVVLLPPERLPDVERLRFAARQVNGSEFNSSLLLRVRDEAVESFVTALAARSKRREIERLCYSGFRLLAFDPSSYDVSLMEQIAAHPLSIVRVALARALSSRFARSPLAPPRYAEKTLPALVRLFEGEYTDAALYASECLAAIRTEESIDVLKSVASADTGVLKLGSRTYPKRRVALSALSRVSEQSLVSFYRDVFEEHKDDLEQDEIWLCLAGLETLNDPRSIPLVREILIHCLGNDYDRERTKAQGLLESLESLPDTAP